MSTSSSRPESQAPYGRKRSNTVQSSISSLKLPLPPPLKFGDSTVLSTWVHDAKESPNVMLNQARWPGVAEGDIVRVTPAADNTSGFLFTVPKDEPTQAQLQISIPRPVAERFGLKNYGEVTVTKVDKEKHCADFVEISFQDQYLGRSDMWRLGKHLEGQCVHADQEISFIGFISAKIQNPYIQGKKVTAAYVTSRTKVIYRSLSAKVTIFIQVCRELWEFAGDGERYNEKIVHSFLPALFAKWREAGTNHIVTFVLISRVYYDQSEMDYAAGPLRRDEEGRWYKDFFKVVTDLEVIYEWKPTLVSLKESFWAFQRDILLTHHYHRAALVTSPDAAIGSLEQVRLVGQISFAHDGPILEALNLGLNPTETHYIDRSLSLTGSSTILITPGTGYFRVSKQLLRLTTTRMLDQGFGLDLISLSKRPLHQSPIFSFRGVEPELRSDRDGRGGGRSMDPLWGGEDDPDERPSREKTTFWWEPFWIVASFWDGQMDLPFRADRFIAQAKMHEIQMLGLLAQDVLSSIEVSFLPYGLGYSILPQDRNSTDVQSFSQAEADKFDSEVFALRKASTPLPLARNPSLASSGSATIVSTSLRSYDKRSSVSQRSMNASASIDPIEESPRPAIAELPSESDLEVHGLAPAASATTVLAGRLSTSPGQASLLSHRSASTTSSGAADRKSGSGPVSSSSSQASRFTPTWLFNPFRSTASPAQTSSVSAGAVVNVQNPLTAPMMQPRPPKPMTIKGAPARRPLRRGASEEDALFPSRASFPRHSPINTPPRDEVAFGKRRSATISTLGPPISSSPPAVRANPSRPSASVPDSQASLARRWQHMFAGPMYEHQIKWKSIVTPGCLPLTVEYFPTQAELDRWYDVHPYEFVVEPPEMRSFLVKPPTIGKERPTEVRSAWALVVLRGMAALRLAQGFQFVVRPTKRTTLEDKSLPRTKSFVVDDDFALKPFGASEILTSTDAPVWLSMSNEIHCISYTGEAIRVRRYVRRMPHSKPYKYECLIWPKLGVGYTELATSFISHGLENYQWNRMDMLVAGYEHDFHESLRYWRTRFVVIPTAEPPPTNVYAEKLNDEEVRLLGIDKLAELFGKARWLDPAEKGNVSAPPPRFLPTYLGPAASVLDENLISQLGEIHASGPLRKKMKSEREIEGMSLSAIAKAMREEDGVGIKDHKWHASVYPDSFTSFDFVSWLVREFRDVSTRDQGVEWGVKLQKQGLFEHCLGVHGFLDGHYYYRLRPEYSVPRTPTAGRWFRTMRNVSTEEKPPSDVVTRAGFYPSSSRPNLPSPRKNKKRLVLSQRMVIDVDQAKRSDQAETAILHYDIIHNPATVFHFELNWIGTTARCIEDTLRQWSRSIERYGLKLVEAYVTEVSDIRERNPFQSCFPLRLVVPPPLVPDLEKRIPEGAQAVHYFEYALLQRFGFILDIEASNLYSEQVEVFYTYRRSAFKYSQFIHRSGVAFVQVLDGQQGFLFLTNRLMAPGRMGTSLKSKEQRPAKAAEDIRNSLSEFCADAKALTVFYDEVLGQLRDAPEEPPPLSI